MPRYHFHMYDDQRDRFDIEGREMPDLDTAEELALQNARTLAAEQVIKGTLHLNHRIDITTDEGELISSIPLGRAVAVVS